jgi:nucleoside 2-deoxyribosyltransferase
MIGPIYLVGSLRQERIIEVATALRTEGFDPFDDWYAAGPIADDSWQAYEEGRGRTYQEALQGYAAKHVFEFDLHHLNRCKAGVLVLPAGKSGHLEIGFLAGQGKPTFTLFDKVPERWDVMYQFTTPCFTIGELVQGLRGQVVKPANR